MTEIKGVAPVLVFDSCPVKVFVKPTGYNITGGKYGDHYVEGSWKRAKVHLVGYLENNGYHKEAAEVMS